MAGYYLLCRPREREAPMLTAQVVNGKIVLSSECYVVRCSELAVNERCWLVAPENAHFLKGARLRAGEMKQTVLCT